VAILFVSGINDLSVVGLHLGDNGNPGYLLDGNSSILGKLPLKSGLATELVLFGKSVRQRPIDFSRLPSLIVNQIADADTHRGALERCAELCEQLPCPVINRPDRVMRTTRNGVSELLQGIPGAIVPKTVRFQPRSPGQVIDRAASEHFYPFIIRVAGEHSGQGMVLVTRDEAPHCMHVLPFDGRDFYLTEYVDYRGEDGLYHKQRIVMVDGEAVIRHSLFDMQWKIHSPSVPFMRARESWESTHARMDRLEKDSFPVLSPVLREINNRLQLEYFGMDCNIRPNGELIIFEVNANMNILFNPYPEMNRRLDMIHSRIYAMLARYSGEQVI